MNDAISVLLMDDEPATEPYTHNIIQVAIDRMQSEGFRVDFKITMTDAIESYYKKPYDVFVLDIDMSHTDDDQKGDGVKVLKRIMSLHNRTKVIMFSGAGDVPDWFESANAHCYAYIHKREENSVRKLIEYIRKSVEEAKVPEPKYKKEDCPNRILIYCNETKYIEPIRASVETALGSDWTVHFSDSLEDVEKKMNLESYGIVIVFQEMFELFKNEKIRLQSILSRCPKPQVIIGCMGKNELRHSILWIVNHHPFRMINHSNDNWIKLLEESLKKAKIWYGKREIFLADAEALKRLHITLPSDILSEWEDYTQEEYDEYYDGEPPESDETEEEV